MENRSQGHISRVSWIVRAGSCYYSRGRGRIGLVLPLLKNGLAATLLWLCPFSVFTGGCYAIERSQKGVPC
jgi:hypothetical protein